MEGIEQVMDKMGRYLDALKSEEGNVVNVKFYLRDVSGLVKEDVATEALRAVTAHRNGLTPAAHTYPEDELDSVSLENLF